MDSRVRRAVATVEVSLLLQSDPEPASGACLVVLILVAQEVIVMLR